MTTKQEPRKRAAYIIINSFGHQAPAPCDRTYSSRTEAHEMARRKEGSGLWYGLRVRRVLVSPEEYARISA